MIQSAQLFGHYRHGQRSSNMLTENSNMLELLKGDERITPVTLHQRVAG